LSDESIKTPVLVFGELGCRGTGAVNWILGR
jgi:hypothetical protein